MLRKLFFLTLLLGSGLLSAAWYKDSLAGAQTKLISFWRNRQNSQNFQGLDLSSVFRPTDSSELAGTKARPVPQLTGAPAAQLSDVLRFDVQPDWVTTRWARVSTVLSEQQFKGLRVPFVSGTELDDLAGSLTYYFDHQRQVRRVTFTGGTGNPEKLIGLATQRFGFKAVPDLGAGMYLVRWNGRPTSALRISHAPVIRSTDPLSQFVVEFEINRPQLGYQLSPRFERIVARDLVLHRW